MKILGIETSCDETAVCVVEAEGGSDRSGNSPVFKVLGNALYSQVKTHAKYGGVFPALAKREHAKNLVPLFKKALEESGLFRKNSGVKSGPRSASAIESSQEQLTKVKKILEREPELFDALKTLLTEIEKPDIDLIAVTNGPGLEPALWVGINFALALHEIWDIPVMPTNHMEGHIASVLLKTDNAQPATELQFPALALLISGGHTQLVLAKNWLQYEILGETRDDAVGEAFDKVARILGLPYPGGPEISKLAREARKQSDSDTNGKNPVSEYKLPRPMLRSDDYDFSFSGLKTAVLYMVKKIPELTDTIRRTIALEFENAVAEVLMAKTRKALEAHEIKTLILGGGVTANTFIRKSFQNMIRKEFPDITLLVPSVDLSTDNAIMIAAAGYLNFVAGKKPTTEGIKAEGNLRL